MYAGTTKKLFLVHGAILSRSPVLRSIVEGHWKESEERSIKLEEWNEQTVEHVLHWLYLGYYNPGYYNLDLPMDRLRADRRGKPAARFWKLDRSSPRANHYSEEKKAQMRINIDGLSHLSHLFALSPMPAHLKG